MSNEIDLIASARSEKEVSAAFSRLAALLEKKDDAYASQVLEAVTRRVDSIDTMLLVASLRLTFFRREKLPAWSSTRDAIRVELQRRGLDSKTLLRGLNG